MTSVRKKIDDSGHCAWMCEQVALLKFEETIRS